jgi:hypothetical protein
MQPVARIFESLSDEQSVILFTRIAAENTNSVELRNKMTLTRKQYYSRLARMIRVGLIKRKSGKLVLLEGSYMNHKKLSNLLIAANGSLRSSTLLRDQKNYLKKKEKSFWTI